MEQKTKSNIKFINLHSHNVSGSPFDAISFPKDHIDFVIENGMNAMAFTDHGNCNSFPYVFDHVNKLKKQGINFKYILGQEAYFHKSILEWKNLKENIDKQKKSKKKDEEATGAVSEDENASKKKQNPLNKRNHLVLLAQNQKGLNNLYKLVSESFKDGNFYKFPRIDFNLLEKYNEGIILSSACLGGVLAGCMWDHYEESDDVIFNSMLEVTERFLSIFPGRFYGELQWINNVDQHRLNKFIIRLNKEINLPLICTADSHYPRPELWKDRVLYKKLNPRFIDKEVGNPLPISVDQIGYELYPKNGDQMFADYKKYSAIHNIKYDDDLIVEAIERTHHIAYNQIENFEPNKEIILPDFVVPENKDEDEVLKELAYKKLAAKGIDDNNPNYLKILNQLNHELEVLKSTKFSKYFLTTDAILELARDKMLIGPGRGSVGGSLLAYILDITQVNPQKHNLMFSRFMTMNQKGMPDIDIDFSRNEEMKNLLLEKWGSDRVAYISNWNTFKLRTLISDISKFYGIDFQEVKNVTKIMENEAISAVKKERGVKAGILDPPMTYDELRRNSETLQKFLKKYPEIEDHVDVLYGQIKSSGTHAGGMIISEDLSNRMPLIRSKNITKSPWAEGQAHRHLEPLGFIKFDILGLSTLCMIEDCISLILQKRDGKTPEFSEIKDFYHSFLHPDILNFDDQAVYENTFHKKNFVGIFQFAEKGMQQFAFKAKPNSLIDIASLSALWRPGAMSSGAHEKFLQYKQNPDSVEYKHPLLKEILGDTYGLCVYQEQLALLAHKIGKDISLEEGNLLRKVLIKKGTGKTSEVSDKLYDKFIEGAIEKGLGEELGNELWDAMYAFKQYSFNKSHCIAYSIISYQCAWLLHYYPAEWCCAYLNQQTEDKKANAISEVQSIGFNIGNININESDHKWKISTKDNKVLIQPLSTIKGLGEKAMIKLIESRPYNSIDELLFDKDRKANKKTLDTLIRIGSLDFLIDKRFSNRKHLWLSCAFDKPKTEKKFPEKIDEYRDTEDFTKEETLEFIQSLTGTYPFDMVVSDNVRKRIDKNDLTPISQREDEDFVWFIPVDIEEKQTRNKKSYIRVQATDFTGKRVYINCWNANLKTAKIYKNRVYASRVSDNRDHLNYNITYDSYSTNNARNCFILMG